jgi:ribonucleoside-triphosphate reductase
MRYFTFLCAALGVGYSVERQLINNLPTVNEDLYPLESTIQVHDSRIGWATGLRQLLALLYAGQIPRWDLSKVRPRGAK